MLVERSIATYVIDQSNIEHKQVLLSITAEVGNVEFIASASRPTRYVAAEARNQPQTVMAVIGQ